MTAFTSPDGLWTIREVTLNGRRLLRVTCADAAIAVTRLNGRPLVHMAGGWWIADMPYASLADLEKQYR